MPKKFVAPEVLRERYERLRAVVERSAQRRHSERIGRREEVLVEGPSKTRPELLSGRTRQNKLVHFAMPYELPVGTLAEVEITGAGTHYLRGEFREVSLAASQVQGVRPALTEPLSLSASSSSGRNLIPVMAV